MKTRNGREIESRQKRQFDIVSATRQDGEDDRIVELAFASEEPYERWWGIEILEVSEKAMRLDRLRNGGPILLDHNASVRDTVGVIESVEIGPDKIARARARLSSRADVEPILADIRDGIVSKASVGYQIHDMVPESEEDGVRTYRITDHEPYEISLVAIAADDSVGVGRSAIIEEKTMPETTENTPTPIDDESRIMALADHLAQRVPSIMDTARDFAAFGKPFDEFKALAWAALEDARKKVPTETVPTELGMEGRQIATYSLFKAVRAHAANNWQGAEFELECSRTIADRIGRQPRGFFVPLEVQRAMSSGGTGTGAELVGTDHLGSEFIDALRTRSVVLGAGARVLENLQGNVDIPKLAGSATFGWIAEGGNSGENDPATASVQLSPKTIAGSVPMTRRLLLQSDPSSEEIIRNDLLMGAALAIDLAAIEGTGANDQPTGVVNQADVQAVTLATPGQPTWPEAVSFETALDNADTLMGSLAYVTTPAVVGHCKVTAKDAGSGLFLLEGDMMNGYPVRRRTGLTQHRIVFGDFSQVLVGFWGVLDVQSDTASLAPSGGLVLRCFHDADIAVRHGQAFGNANLI